MMNEQFILVFSYLFMSCSQWVPDRDTKFGIGYVICILVALHMIISLVILVKAQVAWLQKKYHSFKQRKGSVEAKKQPSKNSVATVEKQSSNINGENPLPFRERSALAGLPLVQIDEESFRENHDDPELLDPSRRIQND